MHYKEKNTLLGHYNHSATLSFISIYQKIVIILSIITLIILLTLNFSTVCIVSITSISILHLSLIMLKNFLFSLRDFKQNDKYNIKYYAMYSILLPIFKEKKEVIESLLRSIYNFNYDKKKLQVLLIVEEIDHDTINIIKNIKTKLKYELIIVPDFKPRTKAKACNYALNFVKGEYVVIYDADDIPCKNQLRMALNKFQNSNENLACIQAKLNYFNAKDNFLTRAFSIEYSILFERLLPKLAALQYPIPLGGTSNHFKFKVLQELQGWDIYNLTEDAEIGMRLAMQNYKVDIINSYTQEEAPITIYAWIKQRSRWLKGFMQTYLLYTQQRYSLTKKVGIKKSFVSLHFMLGLSTLSMILTPIALCIMIVLFFYTISHEWMDSTLYCAILFGIIYIISSIIHCQSVLKTSMFLKNISIVQKYILMILFPVYFILHIVAVFHAIYDLIKQPFYWNKTEHGIVKNSSINSIL